MKIRLVLASSSLVLTGGAERALAQTVTPPGVHTPFSVVDERERLEAFGPPNLPPVLNTANPSYTIRSFDAGILPDGWPEKYIWAEQNVTPAQPVPLLVIFHKFGTSQLDMTVNTRFAQEAGNRGWYAVSPLAANTQHFSSIQSQNHMELVILDMLQRYPMIDPNRIYAVGFSMGSGAAANYAARHLDPAKPMLAAVVAMSGGFALKHTYFADPPTRQFLDFWFGNGSVGSADPFKMARSSVVNFDPITSAVYPGEDLARNLTHVPLQILRAMDEKILYQPQQCDVMAAHMQSLGAVVGPSFDYQTVPFGQDVYDHRWSMLDAHWACEWLSSKSLSLPIAARTLADRDDVYFHFFVQQDVANAFTPFDWMLDVPNNALHLAGTANLRRLTVDSLGAGLNTALPMRVDFATADGQADEVVFTSVLAAPTRVTRDGNPTSSWSYNSTAHELTLIETDGLAHSWSVVP
ncbi:MAG: hypothetical protein ABI054_01980 [Planctomycetota bacterium]